VSPADAKSQIFFLDLRQKGSHHAAAPGQRSETESDRLTQRADPTISLRPSDYDPAFGDGAASESEFEFGLGLILDGLERACGIA
jgi:hypothetical protein